MRIEEFMIFLVGGLGVEPCLHGFHPQVSNSYLAVPIVDAVEHGILVCPVRQA